ncbi:hypothetical protein OIU74_013860 [Salix koriyanagi]|uniref:Secreted protein n=1 Tax=Salix koriyanagi TaxID=2511006 RepID=A0A9Q0PUJ6_9ROSI|nr:hypothetical protein OIU74_013860 [Salix koriyanagi]
MVVLGHFVVVVVVDTIAILSSIPNACVAANKMNVTALNMIRHGYARVRSQQSVPRTGTVCTGMAKPNYDKEQSFKVGDAKYVKALTSSAGALKCSRTSRC